MLPAYRTVRLEHERGFRSSGVDSLISVLPFWFDYFPDSTEKFISEQLYLSKLISLSVASSSVFVLCFAVVTRLYPLATCNPEYPISSSLKPMEILLYP